MTQEQNEWVEKMNLWIKHEYFILRESVMQLQSNEEKIQLLEKQNTNLKEIMELTNTGIQRAKDSIKQYLQDNTDTHA